MENNEHDEIIDEKIEQTPEVQEPEKKEEPEHKQEPEVKAEVIDYSSYSNLGTKEEVETYIKETFGDNPTPEEIKTAKKLLAKMNESAKESDEEEENAKIQEVKEEVFSKLPIAEEDFKTLNAWVMQQPQEYIDAVREATDFRSKSAEEIRNAIKKAHTDRVKSAGGAIKIDSSFASSGTFGEITKEQIMAEYTEIYKKFKGAEKDKKIKELKEEAISNTKIGEWAKSFFE